MKKKLSNVSVVIRSSEEQTVAYLKKQVLKEVVGENVFVINEVPFSKAVKKNFLIGIENQKKWTLALDGDLILGPQSISLMINRAEEFDNSLYVYQGFILDKFRCSLRQGGPHLYLTSNLKKALKKLETTNKEKRPESKLYGEMIELGYTVHIEKKIIALHDFFQNQEDIYRKGYFHGIKHKGWKTLIPEWLEKSNIDDDYKLAVAGFIDGYLENPDEYPNVISLKERSKKIIENVIQNLKENENLNDNSFEQILYKFNVLYNDNLDILTSKKPFKVKVRNKLLQLLNKIN